MSVVNESAVVPRIREMCRGGSNFKLGDTAYLKQGWQMKEPWNIALAFWSLQRISDKTKINILLFHVADKKPQPQDYRYRS